MCSYKDIKPGGSDTGAPINVKRRVDLLCKYIDLRDKHILDCGCGRGEYVLEFLKYSPHVVGVEYDENKVKDYYSHGKSSGTVMVGNAEDLKIEKSSFDIAVLNEVIEHISNEEAALKEIFRVLKPNGLLALFAPNRLYPFETHGVMLKNRKTSIPYYFPFIPYIPVSIGQAIFAYNARNYFPWKLKSMVRKCGFEIVNQKFIWQTFENISGKSPSILIGMSPFLRKLSFLCEKLPIIKIFGVSQLIIAKKPV